MDFSLSFFFIFLLDTLTLCRSVARFFVFSVFFILYKPTLEEKNRERGQSPRFYSFGFLWRVDETSNFSNVKMFGRVSQSSGTTIRPNHERLHTDSETLQISANLVLQGTDGFAYKKKISLKIVQQHNIFFFNVNVILQVAGLIIYIIYIYFGFKISVETSWHVEIHREHNKNNFSDYVFLARAISFSRWKKGPKNLENGTRLEKYFLPFENLSRRRFPALIDMSSHGITEQ